MKKPAPVVFLLDVDNTLLDNDRIVADLKRHLTQAFGAECQERYWTIFEERRTQLGYTDYLGALQRYQDENPRDPHFLKISAYLVDYPFAKRLYPGLVLRGKPVAEPHNLGRGWIGFDFAAAFGCPVKLINDAAMQALGSYRGGKMLFLGLGTGLGSALIADGIVEPMELGHLLYRKGTYEDYIGLRGLERAGKKKWRDYVEDVVARLVSALEPDDVVLGGGNVHKLKELPPGCRAGENTNALRGGFRLWEKQHGVGPR